MNVVLRISEYAKKTDPPISGIGDFKKNVKPSTMPPNMEDKVPFLRTNAVDSTNKNRDINSGCK